MDGEARVAGSRWAALPAVGLGFLAGAAEAVAQAAGARVMLSPVDLAAMAVVAVVAMGAVGGIAGAAGAAVAIGLGDRDPVGAGATRLAVAALALTGWYAWPAAAATWAEGRVAAAVVIAALPVGIAVTVHRAARLALRRWAPGPVWVGGPGAVGAAATLVVAAWSTGDAGGSRPTGDPNVVVVAIDGLRASDLRDGSLPALAALGSRGARFDDAISPSTEPAGAVAAALTGLHPLRTGVWFDGDALPRAHRSVAEVFERAGWATAGFVSTASVGSDSGLDQGFRHFDDDFAAALPGVSRVSLVARVRATWRAVAGAALARRAPDATVARFLDWYAQGHTRPHFAWVHLAAGEDGPGAVDAAVGRVVDAVEAAGHGPDTLVVVVGTVGRAEGRRFLTEAEVHVPLVLRAGDRPVAAPVVAHQVRLLDLAATFTDFAGADPGGETEGASLIPYAAEGRGAPMSTALVGRDETGAPLLGFRSPGVKWVRDAGDGDHLFDLAADPGETRDVAGERDAVVARARGALAADLVAFRARAGAR